MRLLALSPWGVWPKRLLSLPPDRVPNDEPLQLEDVVGGDRLAVQLVEHRRHALEGVVVGDGPHSVLLRGIREAHSGPGLGGHSLALGREEQLALVLRQLPVELVDLVLDERLAGLVLCAGVGLEALDLAGQILHARLVDGAVAVVLDEKLLEVVFLFL